MWRGVTNGESQTNEREKNIDGDGSPSLLEQGFKKKKKKTTTTLYLAHE